MQKLPPGCPKAPRDSYSSFHWALHGPQKVMLATLRRPFGLILEGLSSLIVILFLPLLPVCKMPPPIPICTRVKGNVIAREVTVELPVNYKSMFLKLTVK